MCSLVGKKIVYGSGSIRARTRFIPLFWAGLEVQQTYAAVIGGEGPIRERLGGKWSRVKDAGELLREEEVFAHEWAEFSPAGEWLGLEEEDFRREVLEEEAWRTKWEKEKQKKKEK